jgi:subfamily B ATP-binding cassette protein MsbA
MLVETAMSLAAPWPLKVILDNVVGTHKTPEWLAPFQSSLFGHSKMQLAALAGIATVLIAALGAVASYIDNYYTESVGQWVAHDLRMRVYDHLQHLSLGFTTVTRPAPCFQPSPTTLRPSRALHRRQRSTSSSIC